MVNLPFNKMIKILLPLEDGILVSSTMITILNKKLNKILKIVSINSVKFYNKQLHLYIMYIAQ